MHAIARELDEALDRLEPQRASKLEDAVRQALAAIGQKPGKTGYWDGVERDENGWPKGYFEATAGCLKDEPFERPEDLPPESREPW